MNLSKIKANVKLLLECKPIKGIPVILAEPPYRRISLGCWGGGDEGPGISSLLPYSESVLRLRIFQMCFAKVYSPFSTGCPLGV